MGVVSECGTFSTSVPCGTNDLRQYNRSSKETHFSNKLTC